MKKNNSYMNSEEATKVVQIVQELSWRNKGAEN